MSSVSIYGSPVSQADAAQWLKNNPAKAQDPSLLKVADYDISGSVDAVELSKAATHGAVILDGVHSFSFADSPKASSTLIKADAKSSTVSKAPFGIAVMMGSMFGGIAIAQKVNPALGIGVMMAGMMVGIGISSSK